MINWRNNVIKPTQPDILHSNMISFDFEVDSILVLVYLLWLEQMYRMYNWCIKFCPFKI